MNERDPELDAFVQLLRSATPSDATIASARAHTLASAGAAGLGSSGLSLWFGAKLAFWMLALGGVVAVASLPSEPVTSPTPKDRIVVGDSGSRLATAAPTVESVDTVERTSAGESPPSDGQSSDASTNDAQASDGTAAGQVARGHVARGHVAAGHVAAGDVARGAATARISDEHTSVQEPHRSHESPRPRPAAREPTPSPTAAPPGPASDPQEPSAALADARHDVARERWADAAAKLHALLDGRTTESDEEVQEAAFLLAKCLFALGLNHAAAAEFERFTSRGPESPWFDESLPMLAELTARLPEPSPVMGSVDRHSTRAIASLAGERSARLEYLLGRRRYEEREYDAALAHFGRVPAGAARSSEARLFEGITHVRLHHANSAEAAFEQVVRTSEGRLRELAWMSLARLRYSVTMRARADQPLARPLGGALAAWRHIPMSSPRFVRAFTEEAWALYLGGSADRALGRAHALRMPSLRDQGSSDVEVVRAMIQLEHCQWRSLEHTLHRFSTAADPQLAGAERSVRMARTTENAFRVLVAVRALDSRVPTAARRQVRAALGDEVLSRHLAQVHSIDLERARLRAAGFEPGLAERALADLDAARSTAVERAADVTRARLLELRGELRRRMARMDTIELELNTQRRRELEHPNPRPMEPAEGGPIVTVQGGQRWPWDGEWWPGEVPYFQQAIQNRCGR